MKNSSNWALQHPAVDYRCRGDQKSDRITNLAKRYRPFGQNSMFTVYLQLLFETRHILRLYHAPSNYRGVVVGSEFGFTTAWAILSNCLWREANVCFRYNSGSASIDEFGSPCCADNINIVDRRYCGRRIISFCQPLGSPDTYAAMFLPPRLEILCKYWYAITMSIRPCGS